MKRLFLIAATLTLFSYSSYAQLFTLGPKIGLSSSKINVAEDVNGIISGDAEVGFHAGLFARVSILGFYVQPEALFTRVFQEDGSSVPVSVVEVAPNRITQVKTKENDGNIIIDDQTVTNNVESVQNLTYNKLDVPVMVGIKIGNIIRVNAGPTFSFILDQDIREEGTSVINNISQNYNEANVGYQVGVGLDISKLVIDLKYENNLSVLGESVTIANQTFPTDMRNRLFQLTLGWKLL